MSAPDQRLGHVVDRRYKLLRLIGQGGMGAVYEAEHTVTRRLVAIKLLHASLGWSRKFIDRFVMEVQVAASIGHPNIVEVLDAGTDTDGTCFAALALLRGESVGSLLDRKNKIDPYDALRITIEVLDAL